MIDNLSRLFLLFLIYSVLGWMVEIIYTLIKEKKLVNRGFLIGPYCPIYGVGMILIVTLLKKYESDVLAVFVMATVICMVLEYITSFVLEKIFNTRWWDYSYMKFNLNGRICLETTIPFGLGGIFIMYVVNPLLTSLIDKLGSVAPLLALILAILFFADIVVSIFVVSKVNKYSVSQYKDDTERIKSEVKEYLMHHSYLTRRLAKSFPKFVPKFRKKRKK